MKAGDTLWWVDSGHRHSRGADGGHEVTVISIGRKWAVVRARDFPNGVTSRVEIQTGCVDGGEYVSPARCWASRGAYESDRVLRAAWDYFRKAMEHEYSPPAGATVERIEAARKLLLGL